MRIFKRSPAALTGHAAPPFALQAHDGSMFDLLLERGRRRVIIAFYREDDAPGCSHELLDFQEALDRFVVRHTQVLGVSHNTVRSHARFAERLGLTFPLLADPAAIVAKPYGAKGLLPYFKRRTVVIDGRGVIRLVRAGMPHVEELITFLDGLNGDLPGDSAESEEA